MKKESLPPEPPAHLDAFSSPRRLSRFARRLQIVGVVLVCYLLAA